MSVDLLRPYVSDGDGVIDLGANDGSAFTRAFLRMVGPSGHVLAVEPDLTCLEKLSERGAGRLEVVQAAVGDDAGFDLLCIDPGDRRRNSLWVANVMRVGEVVDVPMVTLDSLAAKVPNLRLVKMDVQGAECHVLDGAEATLKRDLVWHVELWPQGLRNAGRSVDELASQFQAHGYELVDEKRRTWAQLLDQIRDWDGHKSCDVVLKKPTSPDRN